MQLTCFTCKEEKEAKYFNKCSRNYTKYASSCKECLKNKHKKRKEDYSKHLEENPLPEDFLLECITCKLVKNLNNFSSKKGNKYGINYTCKECISIKGKKEFIRLKYANPPQTTGEKICTKCLELLDIDCFNICPKASGGRRSYCFQCQALNNKKHRDSSQTYKEYENNRNKKLIIRKIKFCNWLKTQKCIDCGISDYRVLEFDHVRGEKEFTISSALNAVRDEIKFKKEIDKCDIRCANCHKIATATRANYYAYMLNADPTDVYEFAT